MSGPAPKDKSERRNRVVPQRGEWVDLPLENTRRTPPMPKPEPEDGWSVGAIHGWECIHRDAVSLCWEPADELLVRALIYLIDDLDRGKFAVAAEVRLRMDGLGLTQKGKRDMRWRVKRDELDAKREEPEGEKKPSRYDHLRTVAND